MEDLFLGRGITDRLLLNGSRREGGDGFRVEGAPMHHWGIGKVRKGKSLFFGVLPDFLPWPTMKKRHWMGSFPHSRLDVGPLFSIPTWRIARIIKDVSLGCLMCRLGLMCPKVNFPLPYPLINSKAWWMIWTRAF